jgi:hypothetical protein
MCFRIRMKEFYFFWGKLILFTAFIVNNAGKNSTGHRSVTLFSPGYYEKKYLVTNVF